MDSNILSYNQIIRATRICLSMIIGFAYVAYTGVSDGFWVYITISLLMFDSTTIGGTMAKGNSRVIGTFIATVYALVFIIGFANNFIINIIAIVVGIFLSVYFFMDSKYTFAGLLTWTLPVLLINNNDIKSSFLRLFNIMIGALIAYLMHRLFYPVKAHQKMLLSFQNTLNKINYTINIFISKKIHEPEQHIELEKIETEILAEIGKFARFLDEARVEKFCSSIQLDAIKTSYSYVRHLYRLLNVIFRGYKDSEFAYENIDMEEYRNINLKINQIIETMNSKKIYHFAASTLPITNNQPYYEKRKSISIDNIANLINEDIDGIICYLHNFYYSNQQIIKCENQ